MIFASLPKLVALATMIVAASSAPSKLDDDFTDIDGVSDVAEYYPSVILERTPIVKRMQCDNLVNGLTKADCEHMSSIGMAGQGDNDHDRNGNIWIGNDGPNTFKFTNAAKTDIPITLIVWNQPAGDYQSSFMNVRRPKVSYSLANKGDSVTISIANGISGGWAALNNHKTPYGQIKNTWGEFTTGQYATVDISREVFMGGSKMALTVDSGCKANMKKCAFLCNSGQTCGDSGTYKLVNCQGPNTANGVAGGNPSGGCQGFNNGGHINVSLGK